MNIRQVRFRSWVVLYVSLAAVITLADRKPEPDDVNLSPVSLHFPRLAQMLCRTASLLLILIVGQSAMALEEPQYKVLAEFEGFEIRHSANGSA